MKISKYNIKIPQTGFVILYNSFTDKFLGVSKQVSELLSDDGIAILSTSKPKQYELLVKLGFIIDDKINELTILRNNYYKAKYEDKQLYLMVYPTQDCNLKCWYCYESHKKGTRMSSGIIELIKKNVEKELSGNRYDSLHLGFFCGEPLLDFSKIAYPLGKALKTICDSYGKSFSSFFCY